MRASPRIQIGGALAAVLLSAPLGRWAWNRAAAPPPPIRLAAIIAAAAPPPAPTLSARALRQANLAWILAQQAVARELEQQPEWTSVEVARHTPDYYRQRLMALDRGGDLARARAAGQRAMVLARTPAETYRAATLMARLECDAGDHRAELRYAQKLLSLAPRRRGSSDALKHAAACNRPQIGPWQAAAPSGAASAWVPH